MQTVRHEMPRPPQSVIDRFRAVLTEYSPSCLVTDARRRVGAIGGFQTVQPGHKVAGPALTVNLSVDDLVDTMPVLAGAHPGDVIVVAAHGSPLTAMWGGLMSTLSLKAGVAAGIVDGFVRDVDEIRDLDFPLWYRGTIPRASPTSVHNRTEPIQVNVPVVVGGQVINSGDIVVADENGLAVVPPQDAEEVLDRTGQQIDKERIIREKIASGAGVAELLAEFGHL